MEGGAAEKRGDDALVGGSGGYRVRTARPVLTLTLRNAEVHCTHEPLERKLNKGKREQEAAPGGSGRSHSPENEQQAQLDEGLRSRGQKGLVSVRDRHRTYQRPPRPPP